MKKGTKKIIGIVVAIIIVLALAWLIYESVKPDTVSIGATNEIPNENMEITNEVGNFIEDDTTNTINQNETTIETAQEENNSEEEEEIKNNNEGESEVVSGTTTSREERAVELAKEYFEKEYGSTDGIYFEYDSVNGDGRHIVRAGTADTGTMYLLVNLSTGEVAEK